VTTVLNPALRKAAVLISALDAAQADALLEQMGPERAAKVRAAAMELDDIPTEESQAVIAEFVRGGGKDPRAATDEVELELSPVAEQFAAAPQPESGPPHGVDEAPFAFLQQAPPELLAQLLSAEHPQTLAVVVAHLEPRAAAAVLEQLPPALAAESLARMARIHAIGKEVLADIALALRSRVEPHLTPNTSLGNLSAVLDAFQPKTREKLLSSLARRDQSLAKKLEKQNSEGDGPKVSRPAPLIDMQAKEAPPTWLTFAKLCELPDAPLLSVFAAAPPQVVWLALLQAEEPFIRRLCSQLSATDADALRRKLSHPGPVRLSDIDAAERELLHAAWRLHRTKIIQLPAP
jgi:flagellar motor switch protein FliG